MSTDNDNKYLPIEDLDPDRVIIYTQWINEDDNEFPNAPHCNFSHFNNNDYIKAFHHKKIVLISKSDATKCHKFCGFNKFTIEKFPLPSEEWCDYKFQEKEVFTSYIQSGPFNPPDTFSAFFKERMKKQILNSICNPEMVLFTDDKRINFDQYKDWKLYKTFDDQSVGFVVFINSINGEVHVYGRTLDVVPFRTDPDDIKIFNRLIITITPLETFICESETHKDFKYSGIYGEDGIWKHQYHRGLGKYPYGKNILLRIGNINEFRYICIGSDIFEFIADERITEILCANNNLLLRKSNSLSEKWTYCMKYKFRSKGKGETQKLVTKELAHCISWVFNHETSNEEKTNLCRIHNVNNKNNFYFYV